jgi:hypothetical protein
MEATSLTETCTIFVGQANRHPRIKPKPNEPFSWFGLSKQKPENYEDPIFLKINPDIPSWHSPEYDKLSTETARSFERNTLIRALYDKSINDPNWKMDSELANTLVCVWLRDSGNGNYIHRDPDYNSKMNRLIDSGLFWPKKAVSGIRESINDHKDFIWDDNPNMASKIIIGKSMKNPIVFDSDGSDCGDGMYGVLLPHILKMEPEERLKTSSFIFQHLRQSQMILSENWINEYSLIEFATKNLDLTSVDAVPLIGDTLVNYFIHHVNDRLYYPDVPMNFDNGLWVVNQLEHSTVHQIFYKSLFSGRYKEADINKVLGIRMRHYGISTELNLMRSMLEDDSLSDQIKTNIETNVRHVMGLLDTHKVYKSPKQVYKSLEFENYPLSKKIESTRGLWLADIFHKMGVRGRVEDWACGTGWLTDSLNKLGFSTIGVDELDKYIDTAKKLYPENANKFHQSDIFKWNNPDDKAQAILLLGRTAHNFDNETIDDLIDHTYESLSDDGVFIWDMGDSTQGQYKQDLLNYKKVLHNYGYSNEELKNVWDTVDTPDGEKFMNRNVPPEKYLLRRLVMKFDVQVFYEENFNGKGDRNMIMVCKKRAKIHDFTSTKALDKLVEDVPHNKLI